MLGLIKDITIAAAAFIGMGAVGFAAAVIAAVMDIRREQNDTSTGKDKPEGS